MENIISIVRRWDKSTGSNDQKVQLHPTILQTKSTHAIQVNIVTTQYTGADQDTRYYISDNNDIVRVRGKAFDTLDNAFSALMALKTSEETARAHCANNQDDKKAPVLTYNDTTGLTKGLNSLGLGQEVVIVGISTGYDLGELTKQVSAMERLGGNKFKVEASKQNQQAVITRIK